MASAPVKQIDAKCDGLDTCMHIYDGFRGALTVRVGCELKLFDILDDHAKDGITAAQLAKDNGWDEENVERLLNTLTALTIVSKDKTKAFRNTMAGDKLVTTRESVYGYFTDWATMMTEMMAKLPEEVKSGAGKEKYDHGPGMGEEHGHSHGHEHKHEHEHHDSEHHHGDDHGTGSWDASTLDMYSMCDASLKGYIQPLLKAFDLSTYKTIVDLGAGSGLSSVEITKAYPDMKVTIFELPNIADLLKRDFLPKHQDLNIEVVGGDAFVDDLPKADVYLIANLLHHFHGEVLDNMLKKVFQAVKPGGAFLAIEKLMNDDGVGPITANLFDMMIMSTPPGKLYTVPFYKDLLQKHGYADVQFARTNQWCEFDIIMAKKAA